jgi:hypothetical protein
MRRVAALVLLAGLATGAPAAEPAVWWWYWDRPAAQLPPPPPGTGAAVVARHVILSGSGWQLQTRRSPLPLPPGTPAIPVVHVEVDPAQPFVGNAGQRDALRDALLDVARRADAGWVQLDFEARPSQRAFWRAVVETTHAALPARVRLSVTALASWCHGDRWLGDAPVDEVVPMYFRLGRARATFERRSAAGTPEPLCCHAHGLADDEPPWPVALPGRRYLFLGQQHRRALRSPGTE